MERTVKEHLIAWQENKKRKVLLLRGARQVGKTWSVRDFSKAFPYYLEVNFETDKAIHSLFSGDIDAGRILQQLSAYYDVPVKDGETLVFFDEIQACENALSALRFFYEKRPGLHVIAAGSVLEVALRKIPSFGVGRMEHLFMYPLSFREFVMAKGKGNLLPLLDGAGPDSPLEEPFHRGMTDLLKEFLIVGGMPEVVAGYVEIGDLRASQRILDHFLTGLMDDFSKYRKQYPANRLREIFDAVAFQSGKKFKIAHVSHAANYYQASEGLELLEMAGLIHKVFHTSATGIPPGSGINQSRFKILMLDHGLFQRILGLELSDILLSSDFSAVNKGNLAEQFVGTEMIKYKSETSRHRLFYWHRENPGSHSEVDYIIQKKGKLFPVEVKSGSTGKMQSLFVYLKEKSLSAGMRCSLENFSRYDRIEVYPLYAVKNLVG